MSKDTVPNITEDLYHHGTEGDTYNFYQLPKILFIDPVYKKLSVEAKIAYSIMRDRMSLSVFNRWIDSDTGRVYIYLTVKELCQIINCKEDKTRSVFKELVDLKMIARKKQGLGRPDKIYVLKLHTSPIVSEEYYNNACSANGFNNKSTEGEDDSENSAEYSEKSGFQNNAVPEPENIGFQRPEKSGSGTRKNRPQESDISAPPEPVKNGLNNTNKIETDKSDTDIINHSFTPSDKDTVFELIERVMDGHEKPNEKEFCKLLDNNCLLSWWKEHYRDAEETLYRKWDNHEINQAEFDEEYRPYQYIDEMAKTIVKIT